MNFIHGRRETKTKLNALKTANAIALFGRLYSQSYPSMSHWVNFISMLEDKSASQKKSGADFFTIKGST